MVVFHAQAYFQGEGQMKLTILVLLMVFIFSHLKKLLQFVPLDGSHVSWLFWIMIAVVALGFYWVIVIRKRG